MLKLRYLFDVRDLAVMLLENWEYDIDCLEMLNNFRISSNAIYPFKNNGEEYFLRFSPSAEKNISEIKGEIQFVEYLSNNGLKTFDFIKSKDGRKMIEKETPWGKYYAVVLNKVQGKRLDNIEINNEIIFEYGKTLGKLHKLSKRLEKMNRKNHLDIINWIELYNKNSGSEAALQEIIKIKEAMNKIPLNENNYGLIHGDYEADNVFYDSDIKECRVIDFDDCKYYWYVMDIMITLKNLKEEFPKNYNPEIEKVFFEGYNKENAITEKELKYIPLFKAFENIYEYTKVKYVMEEEWDNEPEWLTGLRKKLKDKISKNENKFGNWEW
ncbi:hypothetical protein FACS189476_02920 [Spirochaetia bacterium]|nr:hypothetical protein FACS189476_02920 [Spirochaetia bacterium]